MGTRAGSRRRLWPTLLLVLALAALLTLGGWSLSGGLLDGGSDADEGAQRVPRDARTEPDVAQERADPVAPRPRIGDCRRLRWVDTVRVVTDAAARPAACGRTHSAQTFAVGLVATRPGTTVDAQRLVRAASSRCRSALVGWLGGDESAYELSMFAYVVAVPTVADRAAGARWWRCDTYATGRPGQLATLRSTTEDALAGVSADRWATCVRGPLGPDQRQVLCRGAHDWRAVSAHRLGDRKAAYPGASEVAGRMRSTCRDEVGTYIDDPLVSFSYGWLRPTAADWRAGQRFGLCFARTRD